MVTRVLLWTGSKRRIKAEPVQPYSSEAGGKRCIKAEPVQPFSSEAGGKRRIRAEPVQSDADEEPERGAGAAFPSWSEMDGRGDDAAAEEYWEDYLRGKMDLVCSVLQVSSSSSSSIAWAR